MKAKQVLSWVSLYSLLCTCFAFTPHLISPRRRSDTLQCASVNITRFLDCSCSLAKILEHSVGVPTHQLLPFSVYCSFWCLWLSQCSRAVGATYFLHQCGSRFHVHNVSCNHSSMSTYSCPLLKYGNTGHYSVVWLCGLWSTAG